jgi:hypothetical protein
MKNRISARRRVALTPLNVELVRSVARSVFPRKNDYVHDLTLFEELLPELEQFGIKTRGKLKRLLTKHRRALLKDDRSRWTAQEECDARESYSTEYVRDALRRQYRFSHLAFIRNALEAAFDDYEAPTQEEAHCYFDADRRKQPHPRSHLSLF